MMTKAAAFAASLTMHVAAAAAVVGGHRASTAATPVAAEVVVPLDVEPDVAPAAPAEEPPKSDPRSAEPHAVSPPTHTHSYPVPAGHDDRPHDPSQVHLPLPSNAGESPSAISVPVVSAPPDAPVHFTLSQGSVPMTLGRPGGTGSPSTAGPSGSEDILPESKVTLPARLLASVVASYPPEARRAEIEADVPVEIVVDERGGVVDARTVKRAGYGLDEAAVRSVRGYRFSAALKDGHPVRVRMRWTVQFRLR